jgi:DNA modification methylase
VIKPYYQDDHCTIYNADCREILPELPKVDLVLTDPPYGIGESMGKNKNRGLLASAKDYGYSEWDKKVIDWDLIEMIIQNAKNSIIFGGNYYPVPPSSKWLIWDKDNGDNDFADCEMAWTNLKGSVRLFKYTWNGMLQENMKNKEIRQHPTQKPAPLMKWCIEQAGEPKTILDPFMGSGTTLRAAKDLNRKSIGIELEEKYCEIAAERLRQEVLPL